jgi:hypothetical protein
VAEIADPFILWVFLTSMYVRYSSCVNVCSAIFDAEEEENAAQVTNEVEQLFRTPPGTDVRLRLGKAFQRIQQSLVSLVLKTVRRVLICLEQQFKNGFLIYPDGFSPETSLELLSSSGICDLVQLAWQF